MFHLLMIVFLNGQPVDLPAFAIGHTYQTREACLAVGREKARAIAQVGTHGRYLCMYERESDAALRHETKVEF